MNFQNLDASVIITLVILAFVVIGFVKGLIQIILTLIALCAATYCAWLGYDFIQVITYNDSLIPTIGSFIIWAVVFILCQKILRFIINPFNASKTGKTVGFGKPAAIISFFAVIAVTWVALTSVRYAGSIAELRDTQNYLKGQPVKSRDAAIIGLKSILDNSIIGHWQAMSDPINSPSKLAMSKIMLMYHDRPMRARMLEAPVFDSILKNHSFLEIAYLDDLKNISINGQYTALYHHPVIKEVVQDTSLISELEIVEFFHQNH